MKTRSLSVKRLFLWICIGLLLSMTAITLILFSLTLEVAMDLYWAATLHDSDHAYLIFFNA